MFRLGNVKKKYEDMTREEQIIELERRIVLFILKQNTKYNVPDSLPVYEAIKYSKNRIYHDRRC